MDIPRGKNVARRKLITRVVMGVVALAAVVTGTIAVRKLKPAAAPVEWSSIYSGVAKHGPMVRNVRGVGSLVPEENYYVPAQTDGRIEKIHLRPGQTVAPQTVLLELSNPELAEETTEAEYNLKSAQADLANLRVTLTSNGFDKESAAAKVRADFTEARLKAERDSQLLKAGLISDMDAKISASKARELGVQNGLEEKRLKIIDNSVQAQLESAQVKIQQLKALWELKKSQLAQLTVRAGTTGVLLQLGADAPAGQPAARLEVGQRVAAGTVLAKIAEPRKLKAELKVTETEAKDIALGQAASIDTRNGVIPGKVIRIDPAAVNGSVTVDVALLGALPDGARPDLSVDGIIELERLADVLSIPRPSQGQPHSTVTLYRIDPDRKGANAVKVRLGRASVGDIEVLEGLQPGDQVILSDTSSYDTHDRIRFN